MKMFTFALACVLAVSGALATDSCYKDVSMKCGQASDNLDLPSCTAVYGNYGSPNIVATEMQAYANLHLERSFEYLLSSSFYDNYQTNRAGFSKLFRKLSDEAWEKTIDLIKHITKRGGTMDFVSRSTDVKKIEKYTVELYELESLAKALDTQKELAERAFFIHRKATRNSAEMHDPEISQYLEEEFIEKQADTIRNLAGHTADLKSFVVGNNGKDLSLALYLFDEYLQKIV